MRALAAAAAAALAALSACALLPLEADRLTASVGGYAVMNCHLDFPFGNEIPYHLQWDKDGETIFSWYSGDTEPAVAVRWGGRLRLATAPELGRGSINVSAVRETDAGLYRCLVTFPNRTPPARNNGTYYYLDVDGGNLIVTPPMNLTVLEGDRAELECLPKNSQWDVRWTKDGEPVDGLPELDPRVDRLPNGSLVLRAAASGDLGEYACRVQAPDGTSQAAAAYLDVQYKAKVVYAPSELYLPFGKPASLDCHFSANPPLTNLRWEKDGFLFDPYNVLGVFYSRNGSLLFNEVDESHEGEYSCTAYNALGTAGASPRVRVRVARPPSLAARPPPLHLARLGAAATLPCAAAGDGLQPPPPVTWTRKDGSELPAGRHSMDGGNLTIADVTEADRGVYVCTARNAAAEVSAESELLIENVPPRAPYDLAAHPAKDSIHLTWRPGHQGIEVDYTVWYRERADTDWRTMKILSRGVTDATLVGLRPAVEYELRVLAQDHIGDGLFSRPVYVRTLGDAETSAETAYAAATTEPTPAEDALEPLEVTARLLDDGALVRWRRGPADESRCTVRWQDEDGGEPLVVHTHHDYVLVSSVTEGARYRATVRCVSGAGGGTALSVPAYGRLRAVAAGAAAALLLLAATAATVVLIRRRRRPARPAPLPPPYPDKRHR